MMEMHWDLHRRPSVLISVTGGAQSFNLTPRLEKAYKRGLAKAAQATNAWVFTGGTDSGVMALTGQALAEVSSDVACVGISTWGVIHSRDKLHGRRGGLGILQQLEPSSASGTNLEPNHSHFVLVDSGKEGKTAWGGEIKFRTALEHALSRRKKVPRVLIVVHGGPGTLSTVHEAIGAGCPVVLVSDSGGLATCLHQYLQFGEFDAEFEPVFGKKTEQLENIAALHRRTSKVTPLCDARSVAARLRARVVRAGDLVHDGRVVDCRPRPPPAQGGD